MDITSEHRTRFKSDLVDELTPLVRERGFVWMPHLGQFRKQTYRGFSNLLLSFSNYADGVMVEGHCGIRVDAVEDTVYQYTNGFREFQPNSHTLITSIGRLEGELTRRRLVESREDALETALEIFATVDEKGEGFWQRFSELEALDELFNFPDDETAQLVPNLSYACLRGLVIAKLLNRPNFEALVDVHRARLGQLPTNPVVRDGYESLVVALRGHWFH